MTGLGCSGMDQHTNKFKLVALGVISQPRLQPAKVFHGVRGHIQICREVEEVVDFASSQSLEIELKPLQMKNEMVGDILQAGPAIPVSSIALSYTQRFFTSSPHQRV